MMMITDRARAADKRAGRQPCNRKPEDRRGAKRNVAHITFAGAAVSHARSLPRRRKQVRRNARSRSEEHTSELQSLMRISYAVFCLKKKKPHTNQPLQYKT